LAGLEDDLDGIETIVDLIGMIETSKITFGGETKRFLLAQIDGFHRPAEGHPGAGADLDKNEDVAVPADEIDLALLGQEIPVENAIAVAAEKSGRDPLTIIPRLLRRRKVR
jgi:hypothetical protein